MLLRLKNSSKVFKFINAILLSKSINPLSYNDVTLKVFCLGKFPIIVSTPDEDNKVILSPIFKSKIKLNSFPIEILFFTKLSLSPINFSSLTIFSFEKSLLLYPLKRIPLDISFLIIIASPELLKMNSLENI